MLVLYSVQHVLSAMGGRIDSCMDAFHMLHARDDDSVMSNDVVFVYVILLLVLMLVLLVDTYTAYEI